MSVAGAPVRVTRDMVSYALSEKTETTQSYIPSVIEPSFGIGRIMTGILEHCFHVRDGGDGRRRVLSFPAAIAPVKVCGTLRPAVDPQSPVVVCVFVEFGGLFVTRLEAESACCCYG